MLDRRPSRKTDEAPIAADALASNSMHPVRLDPALLFSEGRDDLISTRTLVIDRLHESLVVVSGVQAVVALLRPGRKARLHVDDERGPDPAGEGDACDPDPVRCRRHEVAIQQVGSVVSSAAGEILARGLLG